MENVAVRRNIYEAPAYKISEAALYLRLPDTTLRSWVVGRYYPVAHERRRFQPIIAIANPTGGFLSFNNLVEAHVLGAIRRKHKIKLNKVRDAVQYLRKHFGSKHPLIELQFETDGINLFVEMIGKLVNVSSEGQIAMRKVLELHLRRIERDPKGLPIRLYPFTRSELEPESSGIVVIDPAVSFGRPIISRLGVRTLMIAERYKAGERVADLVADYDAEQDEIEEAIRCELQVPAA